MSADELNSYDTIMIFLNIQNSLPQYPEVPNVVVGAVVVVGVAEIRKGFFWI